MSTPAKWKDPRTPVWEGMVKGAKVTIYDMEAYEAHLKDYPDNPDEKKKPHTEKPESPQQQGKRKPASRYNWITKLDTPLKGTITSKGKGIA